MNEPTRAKSVVQAVRLAAFVVCVLCWLSWLTGGVR
jgi:hypothetical protein